MNADLLKQQHVFHNIEAKSKKSLFESISKEVYKELGCTNWETVFDALLSREKYGSTGFGNGIAIPHCRLQQCSQPLGFLVSLKDGIDFDAIDQKPVDLLFILIVPIEATDEHLDLLSKLATILDQNALRQSLRQSVSKNELFQRFDKMISEL